MAVNVCTGVVSVVLVFPPKSDDMKWLVSDLFIYCISHPERSKRYIIMMENGIFSMITKKVVFFFGKLNLLLSFYFFFFFPLPLFRQTPWSSPSLPTQKKKETPCSIYHDSEKPWQKSPKKTTITSFQKRSSKHWWWPKSWANQPHCCQKIPMMMADTTIAKVEVRPHLYKM